MLIDSLMHAVQKGSLVEVKDALSAHQQKCVREDVFLEVAKRGQLLLNK